MNKKLSFSLIALAAIGSISLSNKIMSSQNLSDINSIGKTNIESLTDCEAIDGNKNDGHCTHDDYMNYFCKSPVFFTVKEL